MTAVSVAVIIKAISDLAVARSTQLDDVAVEVYRVALADLDAEIVSRACFDLAKRDRSPYEAPMPSVGAIRAQVEAIVTADAAAIALKLLGQAPNRDRNEPTYYCLDCHDEPSGWRIFTCRGSGKFATTDGPSGHCGRMKDHLPHTFAERCACLPHNPVIRQAKDRMSQARQKHQQEHARN